MRFAHCVEVSYWNSFVAHCIPCHSSEQQQQGKGLPCSCDGELALHIIKLTFAKLVSISSMVEILTLCQNVEELAIWSSLCYLACCLRNPLLGPLSNLLWIKTMYTKLATVAGKKSVILPEFV